MGKRSKRNRRSENYKNREVDKDEAHKEEMARSEEVARRPLEQKSYEAEAEAFISKSMKDWIDDYKECEELLRQYMAKASELAKKLASLKSRFVYGKDGCYRGHLGCWDSGVDYMCLHSDVPRDEEDIEKMEKGRDFDFKILDMCDNGPLHIGGFK